MTEQNKYTINDPEGTTGLKEGQQLFCLGCDSPLAEFAHGREIPNTCATCKAQAPILYDGVSPMEGLPSDGYLVDVGLYRAKRNNEVMLGHIDWYLGYSSVDTPQKRKMVFELIELGMTPQKSCPDEKCQTDYAQLTAAVRGAETNTKDEP